MVQFSVTELAQRINGELKGDGGVIISGIGGLHDVKEGEITFLMKTSLAPKALSSKASAFIVKEYLSTSLPQIQVSNPRLAFAYLARLFLPEPVNPPGIHQSAIIHPSAQLGEHLTIGPLVVIERGAIIGSGTTLGAFTYVGEGVRIGEKAFIHPQVVLERRSVIGNGVIIQASSVIGSDGYGYEKGDDGYVKIPHLGGVIIEDEVEIGASVTIDRSTTGWTRIGRGTKIDNLVQIGHNVTIGPNSLLVAMVGVSGSSSLGEGVILAGQVGVSDHVNIGDHSTIGARGMVLKDVPSHSFYYGVPAQDQKKELKVQAAKRRLPEMLKELRRLTKEVEELKKELKR